MTLQNQAPSTDMDSFAALIEENFSEKSSFEGAVVSGRIVAIFSDAAVIDIGMKSEGRVQLKDILQGREGEEVRVGDIIDVYVERLEDRQGEAVLSIEKARRAAAWIELEKAFESGELVNGTIFGRVKGGFAVDLKGAVAFLPGSQIDMRPVRDISPLLNIAQPFKILKMDKLRSNIVVSRRAVLEDSRAEARTELVSKLAEGNIITGVVKNITDYGAFVDLGGVDGLLHVTDISWKRIAHPSEVLKVGDSVQVQIVRFNKDTQRISLGMKQLGNDPWKDVQERFIPGERYNGRVTNLADYGAFVELMEGIEGLIYVTELSWTRKNLHPSKVLTVGQDVEIVVLEVDPNKRRISLGLKQCLDNPWEKFKDAYPIGTLVEGAVKNVTEFGIFVGLTEELDGMVHLSDVSWNDEEKDEDPSKRYSKGTMVKVKVLDVDPKKERIVLGIKQVDTSFETSLEGISKGQILTGTVVSVLERGIDVALKEGLLGFIKRSDLSRDRDNQRTTAFAVGEKIDAKVMSIDHASRRVVLSIKALEISEEKEALTQYGSASSGATLGAILGEALNRKDEQ